LHVGIGVGWLGLSLGMLTLSLTGLLTSSAAVRHAAYEIFHIFDLAIVIPSVVLTIVTGLVLSLGTPWGLIKYRWVLAKFMISLSIPATAVIQSKWVRELAARTVDPAAEPGTLGVLLTVVVGCYSVLLWTATALSILKPWGRTRWGHRYSAREAGPARDIAVAVADRREVAEDTVTLSLAPVGAARLRRWEPGAHIDVVLPSGLVRQYSLCGDPSETGSYLIAVLRAPEGRGGSLEIHGMRPGARLAIRGPRNDFPLVAPASAYLFIAGGIGITPFLPMIHRLDSEGADWLLIYRGRTRHRMAFADQLATTYPDRVSLLPADTCPRPDLVDLLRRAPAGVAVYCCGPEELIDGVTAAAAIAGSDVRLYIERFAASSRAEYGADLPFDAELRRSNRTVRVTADRTLLDAIHEVNPGLPASCTDGLCGSCVTPVLAGMPDHRDDVLQPHERGRNDVIYPCVSRAHGERIVLDA